MSNSSQSGTDRPYHVLAADDNGDILKAIRLLLKSEGISCHTVKSPDEVLDALRKGEYDLALIDLNYSRDTTSGVEGTQLVKDIRRFDPHLPLVVMTAWASVEIAVDCMRLGANDFVQKPWEDNRVLSIVNTQVQFGRILRRSERLEAENRVLKSDEKVDFIANSPVMAPALDILERIASSDASVLITGENGVGKGIYAKTLHQRSLRADKSFITVNMAGLPEGVFESEMFGHVKGAFTDAKSDRVGRFEMANDGTLFLDEIANLPMSQQQKILRTLETREFERVGGTRTLQSNARIIAATNADLEVEVKEGRFRMDLLYRLNTVSVELPPLSKRKEDLLPLAEHFLKTYSEKYRKTLKGFSESAVNALHSYTWPGNVRELMHAVERGALMAKGEFVETDNLGLSGDVSRTSHDLDLMSLEEVEAYLMKRALARADGKASEAAETLGLSRSAFYRRMQRYGL